MMERVLITGVNGVIGESVAKRLLESCEVTGTSIEAENATGLPIRYIQSDIGDPSVSAVLPREVDVIVHCAAVISYEALNEPLLHANCLGIRNMAKYANDAGCHQFVFFSSIPVIGTPQYVPIDEQHPVNPLTTYHLTKVFGEKYLALALEENVRLVVFRIPSPIGPRTPQDKIIPTFVRKALNNEDIVLRGRGGRRQNYIDIEDIAEAVRLAVVHRAAGLYNIAAEISYSNLEIARKCVALFGTSSHILFSGEDPDEDVRWEISIGKAKRELGFAPKLSLEESLQRIARRYK